MKKTNETVQPRGTAAGFTLFEIMIVVVILAIAAMIAIPSLSSAADMQVRAAANKIAADLDYAKGLAITRQQNFSVVFTPGSESYVIQDSLAAPVTHPVLGTPFQVNLQNDNRLGSVNIVSANFVSSSGTENAVTFNYLGSPFSGTVADLSHSLNSGQVKLACGSFSLTVNVEPMTGYVTITEP